MATITVKGMSCQHCVASVTKALTGTGKITDVSIDLATGAVTYTENAPVDMATIRKVIAAIGFEVV